MKNAQNGQSPAALTGRVGLQTRPWLADRPWEQARPELHAREPLFCPWTRPRVSWRGMLQVRREGALGAGAG